MTRGEPAARTERLELAHPCMLQKHRRRRVGRGRGADRRLADGQLRDLAGGEHVALEQRRRQGQHIRDVVEAVAQIIGWQQLAAIDVERKQVTDGVRVLRPIQPVDRLDAGVRRRRGGAVELRLQPPRERGVGRLIGPGTRAWWHLARAELAHDLFPHFRIPADVFDLERLERQPGGLQAVAVASDAVLVEHRAVLGLRRDGPLS